MGNGTVQLVSDTPMSLRLLFHWPGFPVLSHPDLSQSKILSFGVG